jgi:deoxycytidylate deaminase
MKIETVVKIAIEQAKNSTHHFKLGCVIFRGKKILSKGRNFPIKFTKAKNAYLKWPSSVHAELDAIMKARQNLKGASLLVVRINNKEQLLLAKPCNFCQQLIIHSGIKKIFYSIPKYPYFEELEDGR